jgi:hypothetical protein
MICLDESFFFESFYCPHAAALPTSMGNPTVYGGAST